MPTIAELAERFSARLVGSGSAAVNGFATLAEADSSKLAFLANPLYRNEALSSLAAGLIVSAADFEYLSNQEQASKNRSYLITKNPYALFARISQEFAKANAQNFKAGIHPSAVIEDGAIVASSAHVGPF